MSKEDIKKYLYQQHLYRERKNKDRGHINLLLRMNKYSALNNVEKGLLVELVKDYANYDRLWRKILSESPELRGSDYDEKVPLEQKKQIELGYEVGYSQDIKRNYKD